MQENFGRASILKHNLHQYRTEPGAHVCHDNKDIAGQTPPDVDEPMRNRTWAMTLAIENELWNWDRK